MYIFAYPAIALLKIMVDTDFDMKSIFILFLLVSDCRYLIKTEFDSYQSFVL